MNRKLLLLKEVAIRKYGDTLLLQNFPSRGMNYDTGFYEFKCQDRGEVLVLTSPDKQDTKELDISNMEIDWFDKEIERLMLKDNNFTACLPVYPIDVTNLLWVRPLTALEIIDMAYKEMQAEARASDKNVEELLHWFVYEREKPKREPTTKYPEGSQI